MRKNSIWKKPSFRKKPFNVKIFTKILNVIYLDTNC